jgi:hypothetical protein
MNLTYTDGRNWLPHGVIANDPPIDGPSFYQLGFSLGRSTAEYWTAKTIRVSGSWSIESGIPPWTFDKTYNAGAQTEDLMTTGTTPQQRVVPSGSYLTDSYESSDFNADFTISIDWPYLYKIGDLYYPYITVEIGAGRFTSSFDEGPDGVPSGVAMTAFGQSLACQDYNGGGCVGSVTIETTEYWT